MPPIMYIERHSESDAKIKYWVDCLDCQGRWTTLPESLLNTLCRTITEAYRAEFLEGPFHGPLLRTWGRFARWKGCLIW